MPRIDVTTDSSGVSITGNIAHSITTKAGWTVVNNQIVSKGYKIAGSLEDKAHASAAGAPAPAPTVPDVDDGAGDGPDGGAPQTPAPTTPTAPSVSLAALATPQSPAFHAELARKLGVTLKIGNGDAGDNLVLANAAGVARGNDGDDVLVGNNGGGTLYGGTGNNVHAGLGGADAFYFAGGQVRGSKVDTILDLDFAERDVIVLRGYDKGTFEAAPGLAVFDGGGSATDRLAGRPAGAGGGVRRRDLPHRRRRRRGAAHRPGRGRARGPPRGLRSPALTAARFGRSARGTPEHLSRASARCRRRNANAPPPSPGDPSRSACRARDCPRRRAGRHACRRC